MPTAVRTKTKVLFFVPNLIGYLRLGFALSAALCLPNEVRCFIILILLSIITDFFDGIAARTPHQNP
eukprot:1320358-Amorphochlora_amoeboformis.AAC.2